MGHDRGLFILFVFFVVLFRWGMGVRAARLIGSASCWPRA
jgi:hypothetical protein